MVTFQTQPHGSKAVLVHGAFAGMILRDPRTERFLLSDNATPGYVDESLETMEQAEDAARAYFDQTVTPRIKRGSGRVEEEPIIEDAMTDDVARSVDENEKQGGGQ